LPVGHRFKPKARLSLLCHNAVIGQEIELYTGVNWWINDYTRFMLNVTQSKITGGNPLNATGGSANKNDGADITGVGLRAQVDW
jgi:phosphate-selective porin OprO/OprP